METFRYIIGLQRNLNGIKGYHIITLYIKARTSQRNTSAGQIVISQRQKKKKIKKQVLVKIVVEPGVDYYIKWLLCVIIILWKCVDEQLIDEIHYTSKIFQMILNSEHGERCLFSHNVCMKAHKQECLKSRKSMNNFSTRNHDPIINFREGPWQQILYGSCQGQVICFDFLFSFLNNREKSQKMITFI